MIGGIALAIGEVLELRDGLIHDMGDVSHMLSYAEGAGLTTSIMEVKPLVEQRISTFMRFKTLTFE